MALAAGLAAGVLSGVFGIGGGIVLVPLLGILLGLGQLDAQGMTLAVLLLPIGLPAVLAYRKRVAIPWRLVAAVIAGFVAAVGPGARVATSMDPRHLRAAFAVLVVAAAVQMWRRAADRASPRHEAAGEVRSNWNGLWIGAVGGFLAGLLGIGGGLVMIPLLAAAMRLDQHEAQAVSLAVMLPPVGLPGVLTYAHARGRSPLGHPGAGRDRLRRRRARRGPHRRGDAHRSPLPGLRPVPPRRRGPHGLDVAPGVKGARAPFPRGLAQRV